MAIPPLEAEAHDNLTPSASSVSFPFTVPAGLSNPLLVVELCSLDSADTTMFEYGTVTWNGAALTRIARATNLRGDFNDSISVELWALLNPAAGAGDVVATTSDGSTIARVIIQAAVFSGVDQTTGWRGAATAEGTSAEASVTVTTTDTDSLVWAGHAQWNGPATITPGAGITELMDEGGLGGVDVSGWSGTKPAPTPGAYLMDITGGSNGAGWGMAGFEILAAAGGGTDATATPSGVSATGSVGTVQVNFDATVTLTGVAGTGAVGTATVALDSMAAVEGVSATGAVGSVTVNIGGDATATPAGVSATGAVGGVVVVVDGGAAVTGVSATGAVGSVTASGTGDATVTPSGVSATGQVGSVTVLGTATVAAVTGVEGVGGVGTVKILGWLAAPPAPGTWAEEGAANDVWTPVPKAGGSWS